MITNFNNKIKFDKNFNDNLYFIVDREKIKYSTNYLKSHFQHQSIIEDYKYDCLIGINKRSILFVFIDDDDNQIVFIVLDYKIKITEETRKYLIKVLGINSFETISHVINDYLYGP